MYDTPMLYDKGMTTTLDAQLANSPYGTRAWMGFVVKDGSAIYTIELTDRDDLPFTHKVTTNFGPVYGYWSESTGRIVRVQRNGWRNTFGVLGTFDTRDEDKTFCVKGWAVLP